MSVGVDCTSPISPSALHAAGVGWIFRYLYSGNAAAPSWKDCRPGELQSYVNAGIVPILNFEAGAADATLGYSTGASHGQRAVVQATGLSYPAGCTIYFSVDTDTSGAACADYFRGVRSTIGRYVVGVYGSARVVGYLLDAGLAARGWCTSAWSYGAVDPRAAAYQHAYNVPVGGVVCDLDAILGRTGGWGDTPTASPPPVPVAPAPPAPQPQPQQEEDMTLVYTDTGKGPAAWIGEKPRVINSKEWAASWRLQKAGGCKIIKLAQADYDGLVHGK